MVAAETIAAAAKTGAAAVAAADDVAVRMSSSSRTSDGRPEAASSIRSSMLQADSKRNKRVNFAICGQSMSRDSPL